MCGFSPEEAACLWHGGGHTLQTALWDLAVEQQCTYESLPVCVYLLLQHCYIERLHCVKPVGLSVIVRLLTVSSRFTQGPRPTMCQSVVPRCSMLLRPDLPYAFAHRGTLPMGRVLACVGPWAPAPVWSACMCMCVVFPAPCSSVRGLLTACPMTTAVYFTSVCTNWTLIARFLQLGQIRPQLQLSAAHGEAPECGTRWDIGSWWIKTPSDPPTYPNSAFLSTLVPNFSVTGSHTQAYGCCKAKLPVIMLSEACPHWPG